MTTMEKLAEAEERLRVTAARYRDTMGLTREGAIRRIERLHDELLNSADAIAALKQEAAPEAAERSFTLPRTEHEAFIMRSAIDALFPLPKQEAAPDVVGLLREALTDARLFVELVRIHWKNMGDQEQVDEAADCLARIDAALESGRSASPTPRGAGE